MERLSRTKRGAIAVGVILGLAITGAGMLTGCRSAGTHGTQSATQQYPIRGRVISINPADTEIELQHNAIPGLMEAMTMPYRVVDAAALGELHPGDMITATLLADRTADGPSHLRLKDIVVIAQAKPDYKPAVQYHVPAPGDVVPDFRLLNQSGRNITLQQFRGKVVLMTFIYTRCPVADFCPRMSHNFAAIDKDLSKDSALYARTHLLSVSFDPKYDTPDVLRSYGGGITERYTKETFAHWDFAAPSEAELPKVEQFFDIGVTPGDSGTLQHSLSTIVIDRNGKVAAFYPTNDWTPAEVEAVVRRLAA